MTHEIKRSGPGAACALFMATLALTFVATLAAGFSETHLDKSRLPEGCVSCHKGHGKRGSAMLASPKNELCFNCHGPRGGAQADIYSVLVKRSNHPVIRTTQFHVTGESLPEKMSSTPRHVSCYDCHNTHLSTKENPLKGVRGYSGKGARIKEPRKEYMVCYLCHSDSANLPPSTHNVAKDFDPANASFHPVESEGRNRIVPSLISPLTASSTIDCSGCHGNDDTFGPKGPHGSNYEHILKASYATESGPESPSAYGLCYGCHKRSSIQNDESFKSHKRHILYANASCFACHASHGSRTYEKLIYFDNRIVFPNLQGQLTYAPMLPGKPRCFLNCHMGALQYEHIMKGGQYFINNNAPPGW